MIKITPTRLSQFEGLCDFGKYTDKTEGEIEDFSREWVRRHPIYRIEGPNCQTYAEDLFTFCTGENLPFAKSVSRLTSSGGTGPENHPGMAWLAR